MWFTKRAFKTKICILMYIQIEEQRMFIKSYGVRTWWVLEIPHTKDKVKSESINLQYRFRYCMNYEVMMYLYCSIPGSQISSKSPTSDNMSHPHLGGRCRALLIWFLTYSPLPPPCPSPVLDLSFNQSGILTSWKHASVSRRHWCCALNLSSILARR